MNEVIILWNSVPELVTLGTWIMNMSLMNIGFFIFIILSFFSLSLTVSVDGKESGLPKLPFTLMTISLMFFYPGTLAIAAIPYGTVILLLIFWQKPIMLYLNTFLPSNRKVL